MIVQHFRSGVARAVARRGIAAAAIALVVGACSCSGDDDADEVFERHRGDVIPAPEIVGAAGDDFDPDDQPRIVDPATWQIGLRATGKPGEVPAEIVAAVDRSVVRRERPEIGPGTRLVVTGPDGRAIATDDVSLSRDHRVFRAAISDDLEPGARYQVRFEAVEFVFDDGGAGTEEDLEFFELDDPPAFAFEVPPLELLDISDVRPVGFFGHVDLRFSAPVDGADVEDHVDWTLDGAAPASVQYDTDESGHVVSVRLRSPGGAFRRATDGVELSGRAGLVSSLGGEGLGAIAETLDVGDSSDGLEIRAVGTYERAGAPAVRVLCHDPSAGDTVRSHWDREIRQRLRNVSRRCDVDSERVLEHATLDVGGELSVVDHQHGFDLILDLDEPQGGPIGLALRTGEWGEHVAPLYEGYAAQVTPSYPGPELAIVADGRYLERADWKRVPIRHRGVELVHVVIRHAPDDLFALWLSGGDAMDGRTSFAIADDYIRLDPGQAGARYSYIDMETLVGDPKPGAYQVEVSAPYRGGLRDAHRFLVSDMQLLAKRASHTAEEVDEIWAWTIDADGAAPMGGVDLELVRQNGQVLAACETDDDGFCTLSGNWGDLDNEPPFAVVAEGVDELAYVDWDDTKTEIVEGAIGGADYADEAPYRGALWGERTLYRPGETMSFAGLVRGDDYRAEAGVPIGIRIADARGQEVYTTVAETDGVGALEFDYDVPEMASTGSWRAELFAGDEEIARQRVSVEEFVPERIEVDIDVDEVQVAGTGGISGAIAAEYFFGTAAADADFEVECRFAAQAPFSDAWPQYEFGPFSDEVESTSARHDGSLDGAGRSPFSCDPADLDRRAPHAVVVDAAVFEAGSGTPSRAEARATLLPGDELVGLRSADDRVDRNDGARIEGIVVDADGQVVEDARAVSLEVGSIRYSTTRVRRGGRTRWERERHASVDERRRIELDRGRFSIRVAPRGDATGIFVRADKGGAVTELEVAPPRRFWGWGTRDLDPRPDDPTHIAIEGPDEVTVGQPAEFSFTAPAEGRALVAVETYRVDSWQWLDVAPGENSFEVEVAYFDPNVYVSALFVPTGDDAPEGLDRAFGVTRVDVARSRWEADVELAVPDEREPGEVLDIEVHSATAGPGAKVAVAAVDRGILSMAAHEFDDPLAQVFITRALGVDTFDTVGWYADVSPELFGGGIGPPEPTPEAIMPVEPTAMWSGLVELDDDGRARIDFDIPDYRGELAIAAVVVDGERLGTAEARTTIVDPLALQATAPRFATHDDELRIPVSVTNTTGRPIDVAVGVEVLPDSAFIADGGAELEIVGERSGSLSLAPDQRGQLLFDVRVSGRAGAPQLSFEASGGGERSRHVATVPIYPAGTREIERVHHAVSGEQFDVLAKLGDWLPTSESTELWVTSIPRAPAFKHLEQVLHYPRLRLGANLYNTVARVRPAVYLDRLLAAADPDRGARGVTWRVARGIRGSERLQRSSGRFTFWATGALPVTPWGQAYVLDMLTSARDAGHEVPDWVLRSGVDWLDRRVQRRHDLEDLDLALWVLARQGRPNRQAARALRDALPRRPVGRDHERAVLATASLYVAGDETVADELRALIASPALGRYRPERGLYSPARHEGLLLDVAVEAFGPDHALLESLVDDVADRLADAELGELSLHELGWSITGLGRWAEARMESIPEARLYAAGNEIEPEVVGDDGSRSWRLFRASEYRDVTLVFDRAPDTPVSVFRRTEGVRAGSEPEYGSEGLALSRRVLDADGDEANLDAITVGDLLFVEIEASHDEATTLRDLALVSRIPGGFEIENPRPEGDLRPDWHDASSAWSVDHFEVRDDRLEAFGSIRRDETVRFVYSIRATTAGRLATPPTEMTSMHRRNRWARIAGEPVRIGRP